MTDNTIVSPEQVMSMLSPEQRQYASDTNTQNVSTAKAQANPLPGPMYDAMMAGPVQVITSQGVVKFRPMVATDAVVFITLKSPIYRELMGGNPTDTTSTPGIEELFDLVYQFTHTPKEVRALLAKGVSVYHEAAMEQYGDTYAVGDMQPLFEGIQHIISISTSTMVPLEQSEQSAEKNPDGSTVIEKKTS